MRDIRCLFYGYGAAERVAFCRCAAQRAYLRDTRSMVTPSARARLLFKRQSVCRAFVAHTAIPHTFATVPTLLTIAMNSITTSRYYASPPDIIATHAFHATAAISRLPRPASSYASLFLLYLHIISFFQ